MNSVKSVGFATRSRSTHSSLGENCTLVSLRHTNYEYDLTSLQNASCASASVSCAASPNGVNPEPRQQQTCAQGLVARDYLPPVRDLRDGIWSDAPAPRRHGVTTTAPLTPIALRRALYSMLYRRVLDDLGLSSDYKCSGSATDLLMQVECGGGGGAIANSYSDSASSEAQQKHTCRLLQLEVLYSFIIYCTVQYV